MAPSAVCSGIYLYKTAASKLTNKSIKWEERKPIGIRFNPSDEVLLRDFLLLKVRGRLGNLASGFIKLTDVYKYEPGELLDREYDFGEGKMYFFTKLSKKYPTTRKKCSGSQRTIIARTVPGSGFWKKTGSDSSVVFMDNDVKRKGTKTSLAFYKNDEKSGKTPWLMKEYMLDGQSYEESGMSEDPLVLCVVYYYDNGNQNQRESENESRADMVVDSDSDGKRLRPSSDFDTFLDQPLWKKPIVDMVVEFNSNEKRLRPSLDLDLPSQYIFNCNLDHTATFQQWLHFQFLTSNPNMPTLGAPDSNLQYPVGTVLDQAPHASNGISGECFGPDYEQPLSYNQPNLLGKPSSDVGLWSDIITDTDLLGQNPEVLVVGSSQNLATSAPEQNSILDGQYPVDTLLDQAPHASNGISGECFGPNYERPLSNNQPDLLGKPSSDVGLLSDIITDTDLLGQNPEETMNPSEPIWSPMGPFSYHIMC